jgi:hypothetical protein
MDDVVDGCDRTDDRRCEMTDREPTGRGYGRSWKKWLVIYLVAGAILYGIVYLALQSGGGSGGGLYS